MTTAYQIRKIHEHTDAEISKYNPSYLQVDYDAFMKDPKRLIDAIFDFADLKTDKACYNFIKEIRTSNIQKMDLDYFDQDTVNEINHVYTNSNPLVLS